MFSETDAGFPTSSSYRRQNWHFRFRFCQNLRNEKHELNNLQGIRIKPVAFQ